MQNIQWFPGHMTKTKRQLKELIKQVDCVAEILDARIPKSSQNPELKELIQNKPKIVLLNKCDVCDPDVTNRWIQHFKNQGYETLALDCKSGKGINKFITGVNNILKEDVLKWRAKGMTGRKIRVMIAGIPNVGKSSFINRIAGKNKAKTEDRPGVTRGSQWFSISKSIEVLDTPGVLWPKFEDQETGENLAFTGAIRDEIVDTEQLASRLLERAAGLNVKEFFERTKLLEHDVIGKTGFDLLKVIAVNKGMLLSKGKADTLRAASKVLDDFRSGKLGKITLESPF